MQENTITIGLGVPNVRVLQQEQAPAGTIRVVVVASHVAALCPTCGHLTAKLHDSRPRSKADCPIGEYPVTLIVLRRRFHCLPCDRVFTEPDEVCGDRRHLTKRFRQRLAREARRQTVKDVAETFGVGQATVRGAIAEFADDHGNAEEEPVVRQLGIDEFSIRKGQRYATGLHDLEQRRMIDVVEGRTSTQVQEALQRLRHPEAVEVVSMDMSGAFRAAVETVLPQALIVVDKFHVIARINEAVREVWKRLGKGKGREDPLRKHGKLVLRNRENLRPEQWERLRPLFKEYPELRQAWLLKEDFRRWYQTETVEEAVSQLGAWRRMVNADGGLAEFRKLNGMLDDWQREIVNYFIRRVTQGQVEGKHTKVKLIQRQAFGYRNFANLRRRLLLAC